MQNEHVINTQKEKEAPKNKWKTKRYFLKYALLADHTSNKTSLDRTDGK